MIAAQCAAWQHWQLWHCGARAAPWCVRIGCTAARFGFCVRSTASATALFDLRCHREQLSDSFANAPARTYNWTAVLQRVLRTAHRFEKRFLLPHGRSSHSFAAHGPPRRVNCRRRARRRHRPRRRTLARGHGDDAARRRRRALRRRGNKWRRRHGRDGVRHEAPAVLARRRPQRGRRRGA